MPANRKRYVDEIHARKAQRQREYARRLMRAKAVKEPTPIGTERGGLIFMGKQHPLARGNGWAGTHRVRAFDARRGVCRCDATGAPLDWKGAKVAELDGRFLIMCEAHCRIRSFAMWLEGSGFGDKAGEDVSVRLRSLWSVPCPPPRGEGVPGNGDEQGCSNPHPPHVVCGGYEQPDLPDSRVEVEVVTD